MQRRGELAGCAAELLEQESAKTGVRLADLDRLDQFLLMKKRFVYLLNKAD